MDTLDKKRFGKNLQKARVLAELSRQEVANALEMSLSAYGFYEAGRNLPTVERLVQLAKLLHTSIDELVGLEEDELDFCKNTASFAGFSVEKRQDGIAVSDKDSFLRDSPGNITTLWSESINMANFLYTAFPLNDVDWRYGKTLIYKNEAIFLDDVEEALENYRENTRLQLYSELLNKFRNRLNHALVMQHLSRYNQQKRNSFDGKSLSQSSLDSAQDISVELVTIPGVFFSAKNIMHWKKESTPPPEDEATNRPPASQGDADSPTPEAAPPKQEAPKPRRKRQKKSAPSKNETPSK